jgi:hypothetical protein
LHARRETTETLGARPDGGVSAQHLDETIGEPRQLWMFLSELIALSAEQGPVLHRQ